MYAPYPSTTSPESLYSVDLNVPSAVVGRTFAGRRFGLLLLPCSSSVICHNKFSTDSSLYFIMPPIKSYVVLSVSTAMTSPIISPPGNTCWK